MQIPTHPLRVLIACECSGIVRDAFLALGQDAWSCDLQPTDSPGPHYQGDILDILDGWQPVTFSRSCDPDGDNWCSLRNISTDSCPCIGPTQDDIEYHDSPSGELLARPLARPHWDLIIAHPDCTFLTVAANGPVTHGCSLYTAAQASAYRQSAISFFMQMVNAPARHIAVENPIGIMSTRYRKPDQIIQPWHFGDDTSKSTCLWLKNIPPLHDTNRLPGDRSTRRANQTPSGKNRLGPSADRKKLRAITYPGIAAAMASQWTRHILNANLNPLDVLL